MFESIQPAPPDSILGLNEAFQRDENPDKINLSVGVFKNAAGQTPILGCVKQAEQRLVDEETSKGYLGIDGYPAFRQHVPGLLLGADHPALSEQRVACLQTPGGTGGLRVAGDLLHRLFPQASIWCSQPTWPNHHGVFGAAGLPVKNYPYLNADRTGLDFDAWLATINEMPEGDIICLHASCHNPSGVDPTPEQWSQLAQALKQRGVLPLVDCAYQGFGDGLVEDTGSIRTLCDQGLEVVVCSSYSKNFSLYAERIGALTLITHTAEQATTLASQAKASVRANYSNPPKHGAAVVATILGDAELRSQWERELTEMRQRIWEMRRLFVAKMNEQAPERDFSFIERQRGMFSFSGLTPMQVDQLKNEYSIYIVGSGRINVAGITPSNVDRLCHCIAKVL